ncbi:MAG: hypothetical protein KDK07_25160 [Bauldia sp.]|nr:hypothetical protein [Bauldia sp.]
MREALAPAPDIAGLVARERRITIIVALVVVALVAAAGGFAWNTMLALDHAQERIEVADAAATAARRDAEAARLGASSAMAELQAGRARFAEGVATVNRAKSDLLRATSSLESVKSALLRTRSVVAVRTLERDKARAEARELTASLATANERIATLQGAYATATLRAFGGMGRATIADIWIGRLRADVAYADTRLEEAQAMVAALKDHIGLTVALSEHLHPVGSADAEKLADSSDRLGRLLSRVLDMRAQNIRYSGANKPSEGFNSPGFTGYVLGRVARGKTLTSLPETDTPQLGDIIRYQNGFDMFLLQDAEGEPFVIGMTPVGIAALEPDFGVPRAGALATGIFQQ